MIIDFHCHAGQGDQLTAPWNTSAPLPAYLRRARRAGIDRTVVFPAFHTDYQAANRALARIVAHWAPRLVGFAMVNAKSDAGRVRDMVAEAVLRLGFRGLKIHGHEGMPTREICEAAREFAIPIIVDVAGKAHVIDMFASQYPDVTFVVAHMGSFADDWRAHERVVEQMVRYPNVFADTSGVRRFDYLVQAIRRAGPRRLLFGSDGPWLHPGVELHKIRLLGLPRAAQALVLGGNAKRLLGRQPRRQRAATAARIGVPGLTPRTGWPSETTTTPLTIT